MEVNPVKRTCTVSNKSSSIGEDGLEPNSDDLEHDENSVMLRNCSASSEADPVRWRSSSRARGQCLQARGHDSEIASEIEPSGAPESGEISEADSDQVQSSHDPMAASETKLGPEVEQVLRQRAMSIVLAGGFMVLITDEPAVAKVLQNELLLLTYNLVLTLDVPVALWTKRACKEKLLAMLLASALRLGELDLNYAEAEGRRLVELAKAAQLIVKAKEKALRAAKAKASKEGSSQYEQGGRNTGEPSALPATTVSHCLQSNPSPPRSSSTTTASANRLRADATASAFAASASVSATTAACFCARGNIRGRRLEMDAMLRKLPRRQTD